MRAARHLTANEIKARVLPVDFYAAELPRLPRTRQDAVWVNGGLCPFHADKNPTSFRVNLDTGAFRCFACGAHGADVFDFLIARDQCSFLEALDYLRENYA